MKSIFTFILLLVITTTSAIAQKNQERYMVSTGKLELRSGPGLNFNVIGEVPKGTQVYVISSQYGEWSAVQQKNVNGFVLTNLLSEDNRMAEAERAAAEAAARKEAARRAAAEAIAQAEEAKRIAEEAARAAIAKAEAAKRAAEASEAQAIAAADAASRNKDAAARRLALEAEETRKAVEEANRRAAQSGQVASSPIESTTPSYGSNDSKLASAPTNVVREDKYKAWKKKTYKSGMTPKSFNFKGKFEYKLDNYLKIEVGKNTDVVVKLVKMGKNPNGKDDETVRIVYINSNATQFIRNIPEGEYYCVIAYGKDWRENGPGKGTFTKNALYEKGQDILDYKTIKTDEGINVPSYSLSLDLLPNGQLAGYNNEDQDNISPDTFNEF